MPTHPRQPAPLLTAALFALALHATPDLAQAPATGPYRIAGHIVSATDGRPLQRAKVQILEPNDYKVLASTLAAEDGAFAFPSLKAGTYVLSGEASGYITSRYDAHGGYSTAIIAGAGIDTESLALKLMPEASISGRVTDEAGDPVRRANMALYRESRDSGIVRTTRTGGAQTDDTGAYEIPRLAPGRYFVSATATPWYAVRPQLQPRQAAQAGIVDSIDPSLDVAYAMTFYPEATDSTGATPILLKPGDQQEIDIRLSPQPSMTISLPTPPGDLVEPPPPSMDARAQQQYAMQLAQRQMRSRSQVQVEKKVFDTYDMVGTQMQATPTGITIVGLPPGQYRLKQISQQPDGAARTLDLSLTDQVTTVEPTGGESLGTIKVQLKTVDGTKLPPQTQVELISQDGKQSASPANSQKGETEFRGVDPGDYSFVVFQGGKPHYVSRLLSGDKPLPGNLVHVTAGATLSISVVTAAASASLEGFAKQEDKPAPGVMILLVPAEESLRTLYSWKDQSDLDGSFHLRSIPPGHYLLFAIQDGWDLEWQRAGVLAHYLPLGQPITIPDTATTTLKLSTPLPTQPR